MAVNTVKFTYFFKMKLVKLALVVLFVSVTGVSSAQFSISKVKPKDLGTMQKDLIKSTNVTNDYFSRSRWLAEKRRLRKERNFVEFGTTLQLTQTQFDNWASGGDNTFSGRATLNFLHRYQRNKFGIEYWVNGRYGINVIDDKPFKNEDEFNIGTKTTWKIKNSWSYAGTVNVRSQFSNGYKSRTDKTLKSAFMSPGYVELSIGFNYRRDKSPFDISISPIAGNLTIVANDTLSKQGINGVEKGKHVKGQLGPSTRIIFNKEFGKNVFRYYSNLYAFTNIRKSHIARWENKLDVRATKFFTTSIFALFYVDNEANTPKSTMMQYNYSIGLGLSYNFKNK